MRARRFLIACCLLLTPSFASAHGGVDDEIIHAVEAQETEADVIEAPPDQYFIGTVESIGTVDVMESPFAFESVVPAQVLLDDGSDDGYLVSAEFSDNPSTSADDLKVGERVVVLRSTAFVGEVRYYVTDRHRIPSLAILAVAFIACAVALAGKRGLTAVVGLAFSLFVLLRYTVPQIVNGADPFAIAAISALVIAVVSLTVAHGFSKQTGLALGSTLATLALSLGLSQLFVTTAKLFGMGSESAFALQFTGLGSINLRGLLLAGIVIGVLGVLDDVTTAQTATVKALAESSERHSFKQLFKKGSAVGREHVVSLVNTLALAYAGVSLPLLLAFSSSDRVAPFWVILNGEMVAEEVVRTLIGSTALVLAVPISTALASLYYGQRKRG